MRIGLNLLHALPEIGGGWNYIANLVAALNDEDHENSYIVFVNSESEALVPVGSRFTVVRCALNAQSRPRRFFYENTVLQVLAGRHRLDCMHWFANTQAIYNHVPGIVTVYDSQPFLNYSNYSVGKKMFLRSMMRLAAKYSPMLLPMSQATADDLRHRLGVEPARMTVIPVIVERLFQPASPSGIAAIKVKYRLPDQFWLYVAHGYPHKNHLRLLQAYYELKAGGYKPWPLVLRGDSVEDAISLQLKQLGLESDIIFLPRLERSELPLLYSAATALIFPSLYEGCGIPVIEAMACGCPVVASHLPPIRESAGDAALYFAPLDVKSIADRMMAFQHNDDLRTQNRKAGLIRSNVFRAEYVVPILLHAYHRLVNK